MPDLLADTVENMMGSDHSDYTSASLKTRLREIFDGKINVYVSLRLLELASQKKLDSSLD